MIPTSDTKTEHILVCLSPFSSNSNIVKVAIEMANAFKAELTAIFVETPASKQMNECDRAELEKNRKLVEKNGARFVHLYDNEIAVQIAEYAKTCGATKIVIGCSTHFRKRLFLKEKFSWRLAQLFPDFEIYIIPDNAPYHYTKKEKPLKAFSLRSILITIGLLCAATLLCMLLKKAGFTEANIITVYILSVLFTSFLTEGYKYGIIASVLSVLIFNFLFTEPRFTFLAYGTGYPLTFVVMLIAAILTSSLTARAKKEAKSNAQKAYRTGVLLSASRNLQHAESENDIFSETATQIMKLTERPVILYPVENGGLGKPLLLYPDGFCANKIDDAVCEAEYSTAVWVYQNNEQAGATTKTNPAARFWYLAIRGNDSVHAVAGIAVKQDEHFRKFENDLLLALLGECGEAMERQQLRESKMAFAIEAQREKMRSSLLRGISHDLKTPLTSISGNAEILTKDGTLLSDQQKGRLYIDIYEDSEWLIRLVENLLSVTRMDNKALTLNKKSELISDLIDEAVAHSKRHLQNHSLNMLENNEFLMVKVDASLIIQVLVNLIDNAVEHTPEGSNITISTEHEDDQVFVSVIDDGPGIPNDIKPKIFQMFFTTGNVRSDARRGLGLGLALCRAIISAHGGKIWVSDNNPHGSIFTFSLPLIKGG
ncbi:MAG TPA: histidine kinase [Clostridiales bacterium]|jgi:two-component system sensor histidine kinase KdpD|nr:histidine kinase [Clostridiales bacterium]